MNEADFAARPTAPLSLDSAERFDVMYEGTPPWDIGRPQSAFLALHRDGRIRGEVLDVGCGTGEHVLMAAAAGLEALGIDTSPRAIAAAERKAAERSLGARFLVGDALELAKLGKRFDTVVDCGLFHVFPDEARDRYVRSLAAATLPGGWYFLLCFSEHQPGDQGPRRVTQQEIRDSFADGWKVESIEAAELELAGGGGAAAWLAAIERGS